MYKQLRTPQVLKAILEYALLEHLFYIHLYKLFQNRNLTIEYI